MEIEVAMKVLFIAYQAASDPLMESQGFSYMRVIAEKEAVQYSLLTFETRDSLASSNEYISGLKNTIKWKYLMYLNRPRFPATCLNIILGIFAVFSILKKDNINVVHARGLISALIAFIPAKLLNVKFFFDTRGFLADKYVGGGLLSSSGLLYKMMKWGENALLKKCDFFTLETTSHARIIKETHCDLSDKMEVIPCCSDLAKFDYSLNGNLNSNSFNIVYLGKFGTWYLINEMLDFFKVLSSILPDSRFIFLTQDDPDRVGKPAKDKGIIDSQIEIIKPLKESIPALLAGAGAGIFFINPYKRYNSSPVKFGEYLACGLPVVSNAGIGDCDEIIERERVGVVITQFSGEEYKRAIYELKKLLSEGEILRERCRSAAAKYFDLEMGAEKYLKIYKQLLAS